MSLWLDGNLRRQPVAVNLWSATRRAQMYVASLDKLSLSAMQQLEGGLYCPFLLDFGLNANQRAELWQDVWDRRTLVRTATLGPVSDENLLRVNSR